MSLNQIDTTAIRISRVALAVRFVANIRGTRELKDAISRDILRELKNAQIGVASSTFEIVGMPKLYVERKEDPERTR